MPFLVVLIKKIDKIINLCILFNSFQGPFIQRNNMFRTAVHSIRTPKNGLCQRWNTSDVFSTGKNAFNFPSKYSGARWVTHEGAQVLKQPVLKPIKVPLRQRVTEYFSDPNNCVFPKHLHPWQKFACGTIGLTGGIIGIGLGTTAAVIVLDKVAKGMKYGVNSYQNWSAGQQTISSSTNDVDADVEESDSLLDTIADGVSCAAVYVFKGLFFTYEATPEVVVDSVKFITTAVATPAFAGGTAIMFGGVFIETKKFFKEVRTMENCCNIIRFGAKGTGTALIMGSAIAVTTTFAILSGLYAIDTAGDIKLKWDANSGDRDTPYRPVGDEYDQVYDTNGPILD